MRKTPPPSRPRRAAGGCRRRHETDGDEETQAARDGLRSTRGLRRRPRAGAQTLAHPPEAGLERPGPLRATRAQSRFHLVLRPTMCPLPKRRRPREQPPVHQPVAMAAPDADALQHFSEAQHGDSPTGDLHRRRSPHRYRPTAHVERLASKPGEETRTARYRAQSSCAVFCSNRRTGSGPASNLRTGSSLGEPWRRSRTRRTPHACRARTPFETMPTKRTILTGAVRQTSDRRNAVDEGR